MSFLFLTSLHEFMIAHPYNKTLLVLTVTRLEPILFLVASGGSGSRIKGRS